MKKVIIGDRAHKEVMKELNSRTKQNLENNVENRKKTSKGRSCLKSVKKAEAQTRQHTYCMAGMSHIKAHISAKSLESA